LIRLITAVAILSSGTGLAEPRLAVHPLELGSVPPAERESFKAQFEVLVAREPGVQLAGSARVEDALLKSAGERCDVRDSCLRFLAEATDSLYAMHMRLDGSPDGVIATARVVRSDGAVVRRVRVDAETARDALVLALNELKLGSLESAPPVSELPVAELTPPPLPPPEPLPHAITAFEPDARGPSWKRVAGWSLVGVGGATLAAGGVLAGLAVSGAASNPPDASGAVTADRARGAATALKQSNIAAVLIPAGATLTVLGGMLVLWPSPEPGALSLGVAPVNGGLAASVSGALP
jgi:hypothetical protein